MPQLTAKKLEQLFAEYGWALKKTSPNQWESGFAGEHQVYPLFISLNPTYISLEIRPIVDCLMFNDHSTHLAPDLLELNSRLQVAKVTVREHGEICLSCQILALGINLRILSRVLEIIGYYADIVSQELIERFSRTPQKQNSSYLL